MNINRNAERIAQGAEYGRVLGRGAAVHALQGIGADDAVKVLNLARRGELAEVFGLGGIAERIPAAELARDLFGRRNAAGAAEAHAAMVAAWGPAFYDRAIDIAQQALGGADPYA
jgi:hypothetical protein